ncbi:VOC family protein [Myroides ceti]|jgi:catechol 2,3-dioxygenase-like lactoylglutathione lyase family enzyme|uniref:VOC family protein n=1 Tax=Paenimyroides ceti TaxID=395087 RepID=A0ABT8CQY8_9FLAO|nr:VOC family protein [Paenimyroides ceti]MDN3706604.1 VOC family protein [Paenimyroides ceti]
MKLGAFSISLSVNDLMVSKQFYETLGFTAWAGSVDQNYLIMKSGTTLIGIFQNMFEGNLLTFNPGWDQDAQLVEGFEDIRTIQETLQNNNIELLASVAENTSGPASLMVKDPDGNIILIDQHVG